MVNSNLKDNEKFYFTEFYSLYQRVLNLEASARAFPGLTGAEAYIPLGNNLRHAVPYWVESVRVSPLKDPAHKVFDPFYKIDFAIQYVSESKSPEQYVYRINNFFQDIAAFNMLIAVDILGYFPVAGQVPIVGVRAANAYLQTQMANYQMEREESFPYNEIELKNMEIFRDIGESRGAYRERVPGAGLFGQNLPTFPSLWPMPAYEDSRPKMKLTRSRPKIGFEADPKIVLEQDRTIPLKIFEKLQPGFKFSDMVERDKIVRTSKFEKAFFSGVKTVQKITEEIVGFEPESTNTQEPLRNYNQLPSGRLSMFAKDSEENSQMNPDLATDSTVDSTVDSAFDSAADSAIDSAVDSNFFDKMLDSLDSYPNK